MKKAALFVLSISFFFWACTPDKPISTTKDQIVFTGNIKNTNDDQLSLRSGILTKNIELKDGQFISSLDTQEPLMVNFSIDRNIWGVFAKPGDTIHIEFDSQKFSETISFAGSHAEENHLRLITGNIINDSLGSSQGLYSLDESAFLSRLDRIENAIRNAIDSFREKNPDADTDFLKLIEEDVRYAIATPLFNYEMYYPLYSNDTVYKTSETLEAEMAKVKVENPELLGLPQYTDFINGINFLEMAEILKNNEDLPQNEKGLFMATTQAIDKRFKDPQVKNYLLFDAIKTNIELVGPNDIKEDYLSFLANSENELYQMELEKGIAKWDHLQAGMEAPDFNYPDIDSNFHALSDYKGKYVYIDVWASWCGPCLMQQPALEEIEEQYKDNQDIVFMAVSIDQNASAWKNMLTQKKMDGVQILAEGAFNSKIAQEYNIGAIPRYIMIDKEGKIIDASAPRPMSDDIKVLLSDLLQP